ncbi:MAG: hypothetical protein JW731_10295 [Bacteroidales bacterium]|nr:hypothetical protein [Bacteroidales bacterium]
MKFKYLSRNYIWLLLLSSVFSIPIFGQEVIGTIRVQGNEDILNLAVISEADAISLGHGVVKIALENGVVGAAWLVPTTDADATEIRMQTPSGTKSWKQALGIGDLYWWPYGGVDNDVAYSIIQPEPYAYVIAGGSKSWGAGDFDMLVFKSANIGSWGKVFGSPSFDICRSVRQTSDDGYILIGSTNGFGAGENDFYYKKIDAAGNNVWGYAYGTTANDNGYGVIEDTDGGFLYAGETNGFGAGENDVMMFKQNTDNTIDWAYAYGTEQVEKGFALVRSADGGLAVAGIRYVATEGNFDMLFEKFDAVGTLLYGKGIGGDQYEEARSLVALSDGSFVLAGQTSSFGQGGADFYAKKLDEDGNSVWGWAYGYSGDEMAFGITSTSDNGFAIVGETYSVGAGMGDVWLVKIDSEGELQWSWTFGGPGRDVGYSIIQDSDGNYCIVGETESFGAGQTDVIFIQLSVLGEILKINAPGVSDSIINKNINDKTFVKQKLDIKNISVNKTGSDLLDISTEIIQVSIDLKNPAVEK